MTWNVRRLHDAASSKSIYHPNGSATAEGAKDAEENPILTSASSPVPIDTHLKCAVRLLSRQTVERQDYRIAGGKEDECGSFPVARRHERILARDAT
jgi:hypothetical protein